MKSSVIIRPATKADAPAIYQCNVEALGYDFPLEKTIERVVFIMDKYPEDCFLVAVLEERVVGYIHASDYECTYMEAYKDIEELAVLNGYQGYGIGRKLLNACELWAKGTGVAGVRLISGVDRHGAHEFYLKCGYTHRKNHKNFVKNFK